MIFSTKKNVSSVNRPAGVAAQPARDGDRGMGHARRTTPSGQVVPILHPVDFARSGCISPAKPHLRLAGQGLLTIGAPKTYKY
jgi:hypothetical protein